MIGAKAVAADALCLAHHAARSAKLALTHEQGLSPVCEQACR
jgi:hypothetical protein